jgi:substrate import-associated zinc metallohydrolase lipoprotein
MKIVLKLTYIWFFALAFISCRKEKPLDGPLPDSLGGDTWARGALDKWILDSLTKPYNIAVKYRWDPWELNLGATLVPPEESKVVPAMSAIKQIWIDPYTAETGSDLFIKRFAPKEFILVGSPQYNPNNTIVLGQAEGANKIVMFVINEFDKSNITELRRMLHTIEHEFAHILHQNVMYPVDYKTITGGYSATWFNVSDAQALQNGYITAYAIAGPDEDFVEMIATMLVEGKNRYDEMIASTPAAIQALFRKKEEMVVTYFRQVWNIDFYSLQQRTQNALNSLSPAPALSNYFGFGKPFIRAGVNPANTAFLPHGSAFITTFNTAKTEVAKVGTFALVLDSMAVFMSHADSMTLRMYMHNTGGNFQANYRFSYVKDASGIYDFTFVRSVDANAGLIRTAMTALIDYFNNNTFKIDWYRDPNNTVLRWRVAFTPQQLPNGHFVGLILP